jgi:hypothetical protein
VTPGRVTLGSRHSMEWATRPVAPHRSPVDVTGPDPRSSVTLCDRPGRDGAGVRSNDEREDEEVSVLTDHRADPGDDVPADAVRPADGDPRAATSSNRPRRHAGSSPRRRDPAERAPGRGPHCGPSSCEPTSVLTSRPTTSVSSPSSTRSHSTRPRPTTSSGRPTPGPGADGPRSVRRRSHRLGSGGWPSARRCAAGGARWPGSLPAVAAAPSSTAASPLPAPL